MNARAILFGGVDQVAAGKIEIPEPGPGEALVANALSCISPGTELRCLDGKQGGAPEWPFVPGYAAVGQVIAVGQGVDLAVGTRVFCANTLRLSGANRLWGGHVSHAVQRAADLHPLPDSVSFEDACLTRLAAIAYHGLRLSRPQPHETVAVVGLGVIGQLSARLHALTGARVIGADPASARTALLRASGMEAVAEIAQVRTVAPDGADIVVDATGVAAVLPQALAVARDPSWDEEFAGGPRLVIQGSYASDFTLPYGMVFQKEATVLVPRDQQPRDQRAVLDLIARGRLDLTGLLSGIFAPEDAAAVYARLRDPAQGMMTAAFRWM